MRIAYGIHGYGRGHATRALSVLPRLAEQHELMLLAGGEAHQALRSTHRVMRIPELRYCYDARGRISQWASMQHNLPILNDLLFNGPVSRSVRKALRQFDPEVLIFDCEPFTARIAAGMGIPTISFDNFGALVYGQNDLNWWNKLQACGYGLGYRALFPAADRGVVSSILDWPIRRQNIFQVAPVIREDIRQLRCTRGEHLLVYISQGDHELTPRIERALAELRCPVRLYGTSRVGHEGCIHFKPMDNDTFVEDLATCRALFGTVGNQMVSEVLYLGKPMLGMPVKCIEQIANVTVLEKMGVGMSIDREQVTAAALEAFLAREQEFLANAQPGGWPELPDAAEVLLQSVRELARKPSSPEAEPWPATTANHLELEPALISWP